MHQANDEIADLRVTPRDANLNDLFSLVRTVMTDLQLLRLALENHMKTEEESDTALKRELSSLGRLVRAFPKTPTGEPDIEGHHDDHVTRMGEARAARKRWDQIKNIVVEVIVRGVAYGFIIIFLLGVKDWIQHPVSPEITSIAKHIGGE